MIARSSVSPERSFSKGSNIVIYNKRFVAIFVGKFDSPYTSTHKKWGAPNNGRQRTNLYWILLETPQHLT